MTIHAVPDSAAPGTTYSAAQAAQLLGVSERRVRQLVEEGRSPRKRRTSSRRVRLVEHVPLLRVATRFTF